MDLTFTDTLSVKGAFQQAVEYNDDWTFLIAFALLKKALAFFDVIYWRSMITLESSPAYMVCSRDKLNNFSIIL